jgi:chromosomal replication initiator protein
MLQQRLSRSDYELWFTRLAAVELRGDCLHLRLGGGMWLDWIANNYSDLIIEALASVSGRRLTVNFLTPASEAAPKPAPAPAVLKARAPRPARAAEPAAPAEGPADALNPASTFETFVVGNNSYAHAAAVAVAQTPGRSYNPLFLFGGTGLGKTHLLHAIGQHVRGHLRGARVAYVSCERFTNEFIEAIQDSRLPRFRKKFRETDVLLIDDVQFLVGKERIQEEFFHTFNALHEARKQIVLTCDRPAADIQGLEQRLVSRFEWGQVADLHAPDRETRLAILRRKAAGFALELPAEVAEFLADHIHSNVRRLEGALVRCRGYVELNRSPLTINAVRDLLKDVLLEEGRLRLNIETIQRRVADHYQLRVSDLLGRRRPEHIAFPRQVAMYLTREILGSSLSTIGDAFGGRDHGTVLHAHRQVRGRMEVDPNVRKTVLALERLLRG